MDSPFRFSSRPQYFQELIDFAHGAGAGDRIAIATMGFDPRAESVATLAHELAAAARRGTQVLLWVDALTFLQSSHPTRFGPLWYGTGVAARSHRPFGERFALLEELRAAGGAYIITNRPRRPYTFTKAGRSHIKLAVLNDHVYLGGNNLERPLQIDIMASWQDKPAADYLYDFARQVAASGSPRTALHGRDTRHKLDTTNTLLIDAGVPRQSLILDEACRLIDETEERLFMTCQFFPGGRTGQRLAAAIKRGVKVTLFYSPASTHGHVERYGHTLYEWRERWRLPAELFAHRLPVGMPKLHAKVLVSEKAAMIGSHNYVVQGVAFGTAEIALINNNPAFGQELQSFATRQITNEVSKTTDK